MTDLPDSDDELLSSFLDGELTDEERSRVDARLGAEPELAARLDELRAAAALAATPVTPLRTGDTERLIAAALAASDTASNVTDIGAPRSPRTSPWRTRIIGVAAGVALLAVAVPALRSIDWSSDDYDTADDAPGMETAELSAQSADTSVEMADEALVAPDDSDGTDDSGGTEGDEVTDATSAADMHYSPRYDALVDEGSGFDPLPDDLGSFDDLAALQVGARDAWTFDLVGDDGAENARSTTTGPTAGADPTEFENDRAAAAARLDQYGGCGSAIDTLSAHPYAAAPVAVDYAGATIAGEAVTVGLVRLADGSGVLFVLDVDGCTIRYEETLLGP